MGTAKLYVGNLPFSTTDSELVDMFAACGDVKEAKIITDRDTGRSRGFAFVTMETEQGARKGIEQFHEVEMGGRRISVSEAREKEKTSGGRGGYDDRPPRDNYRR